MLILIQVFVLVGSKRVEVAVLNRQQLEQPNARMDFATRERRS
jgi:hypothetical protein